MASIPEIQAPREDAKAHGDGARVSSAERPPRVAPCPSCGDKPRSDDDRRRFFKLVSVAYDNWPERCEFQPDSAEHLRAWLLCKAKHRTVVLVNGGDLVPAAKLAAAAVRAAGAYAWFVPHGDGLAVIAPKSIANAEVSQRKFNSIRDAVSEIIEAEVGVSCDQLLREHGGAA